MTEQPAVSGAIQSQNLRVASARPRKRLRASPRPGLRERKKQRLLSEIRRIALRLFARHGYEETTIEQIADAVEISPSTIFRYFPNKEDLVLTDDYDPLVLASLAKGPVGEPPVAAIRRALVESLGAVTQEEASVFLLRGRLMLDVPELRARLWDFLQQNEALLCQVFAAHSGRDPEDLELRVAAAAITGALMVALTEWIRRDGKADMVQLLDRALNQLEVGLAQVGKEK